MATGKRKLPVNVYGKRPSKRHLPWHSPSSSPRPPSSHPSPPAMSWVPSLNQLDRSQKPLPAPANKPMSQKAASQPAEPEDEQVNHLMEFTGLPRTQAIRYLKAKSNDVNAAAMAFFEGEDISKAEQATQWDEAAWSTGHYGSDANEHLRPLASSAAATRPNSPAPSASGRANLAPTSKQQEDDDFAKAMAMSQGDVRGAYQQETGRIAADGQQVQFGPATRDTYEKEKWAMIPISVHNTSEVVPDAEVEQRIHTPGEPRLLKYLPSGDYTPNLLTICSAIDGAREAMLLREHLQLSYGQDVDWWRGHPIALPKIVNLEDASPALPEADKHDELLAEVQRLMAFLGASSRSYASVGALTQNDIFTNANLIGTPSRTMLELFLQQWTVASSAKVGAELDMSALFSTIIGTSAPEGINTPAMSLVDMQVHIPQDSKSDLFEQLDDLLWDTRGNDSAMADNYIERPAEVLVMRAYQQNASANPQLRLEVPAEFYVDKYLSQNIEATRATRARMAAGRQRIAKIEMIERKLQTWRHPTKNSQLETRALLRHTFGHFSGQNRVEVLNADKTSHLNAADMAVDKPHYQEIARKLEKLIASIDDKLLTLTDEKEKTRKAIADMSKAPPAGLQPEDLKHRYTLRGVATKPNITYVLCPIDPDTADPSVEEMLDDDSTPPGMRWWRMEYEVSGAAGARITKTRSADYDVLRAVELEHSSALLVYASDRVTDASLRGGALPAPLAEFVEKDDSLFAAELRAERSKPPAYDFANDDMYRSNERASLDSTRVEGGGSDIGIGDEAVLPEYEDDFMGPPGFNLNPIKQGYRLDQVGQVEMDDAPVHEIKLDTPEEIEDEGVEMVEVEKEHAGATSRLDVGKHDEVDDTSLEQDVRRKMQ